MAKLASEVEGTRRRSEGARRRRPAGAGSPVVGVVGVLAASVLVGIAALNLTHGGENLGGAIAAGLRFVRYVGSLVAVGGFVFLAWVRPVTVPVSAGGRRATILAAVLTVAATALAVPFQAAYLAGDMASAVDLATLGAVIDSGFGTSAALSVTGGLVLALGVRGLPSPIAVGPGAAASLLLVGAYLLTGHTVVSEPRLLVLVSSLVHALAAAVWIGGLVALALSMRELRKADDPQGAAKAVARYSVVAAGALVAVALAGGALAWVEVRTTAALATPYGALLTVKIVIVTAVVFLGAYNNRRLVPAIQRGSAAAWSKLDRIVRWEVAGLVTVVAVTAVLVNVVPARIDAGVGEQVIRTVELGPDHMATVVVEPARPGSNEVHVFVDDGRGALSDAPTDMRIVFVPPGADHPAETVTPQAAGPGHYLHVGSELDGPGEWRVGLESLVGGQEHSATVAVPVVGLDEWDGW